MAIHSLVATGYVVARQSSAVGVRVAFKFRITPALLVGGIPFSALMGAVGELPPALRAARIPVSRALREI